MNEPQQRYDLVPVKAPQEEFFARISETPGRRSRQGQRKIADREGEAIDLGRIVRVLRLRWATLLVSAAAAALLAVFWASRQVPRFASAASLQIVLPRQQLTPGLENRSEQPAFVTDGVMNSQQEIVRSRGVAGEVVDSLPAIFRLITPGLPERFVTMSGRPASAASMVRALEFSESGWRQAGKESWSTYAAPVKLGDVTITLTQPAPMIRKATVVLLDREAAIDRLTRNLTVAVRDRTSIMDVRLVTDSYDSAIHGVNAVVGIYRNADTRSARSKVRRRRDFLEEQLGDALQELSRAEFALSAFRGRQQSYSPEERFASTRNERDELGRARNSTEAEIRLTTDILTRLRNPSSTVRANGIRMLSSTPVAGNPTVGSLSQQLLSREAGRNDLISGPRGLAMNAAEVQRADTVILAIKQQLLEAVEAHVEVLQSRLATIDSQLVVLAQKLRDVPAAQSEQTQLAQSVEVVRDQAALLRTELQRIRIAEAAEVGQVEIVDLSARAQMLAIPAVQVIAFAALLGFLAAALTMVVRDRMDDTINGRESLEKRLGMPMMGTVPQADWAKRRKRLSRTLVRMKPTTAATVRKAADRDRLLPLPAEPFRQILTNVLYSGIGSPIRTLLITSAHEGEGKTSIARNLAIAFAEQRHRVLLVDCDLIRGSLTAVYGAKDAPGVRQLLNEDISPASVIVETPVPGLWLLPAGRGSAAGTPNANHRFAALLREMSQQFDITIIDSAPILAVSDAIALSVACDGVLLVTRPGSTEIEVVAESLRQLDAVSANVLGAVLNDADGELGWRAGYKYDYAQYARTA